MSRNYMPFSLMAILLCCLSMTGCNKSPKQWYPSVLPTFSMNVAPVPDQWPLEDKHWNLNPLIAAQEQKTYEEKGAPDFFYLYWRNDGKPMTTREFETLSWVNRANKKNHPLKTPRKVGWIYLDEKIICTFTRSEVKEEDLTDKIDTICTYGDPNEIKDTVDVAGNPNVVYQYYSDGKVYYFLDGKKVKEENQPRMEGFFDRR
jgi:hypothetical protein